MIFFVDEDLAPERDSWMSLEGSSSSESEGFEFSSASSEGLDFDCAFLDELAGEGAGTGLAFFFDFSTFCLLGWGSGADGSIASVDLRLAICCF